MTWFSGEIEGDRLSSTEYKGGLWRKLTFNKLRSRGGGEDHKRDQIHFIVTRPKSSDPPPAGDKCLVPNQNELHQNCTLTLGLVTLLIAKKEEYNAWF